MNRRSPAWVIFAVLTTTAVRAEYVPMPMPISKAIDLAEAVVITSVAQYSPDPALTPLILPHVVSGANEIPMLLAMRQGGIYRLKLIQAIKGQCEPTFEMHLPMLSSFYYDENRFDLPLGGRVLLLLKRDPQKKWAVIDPLMPLIPLPATVPAHAAATNGAPTSSDTLDVLLGSLQDNALRPLFIHLLRDVKDQRALEAMRTYSDDQDRKVRSEALYCMAVNQDVSAIPKIAKLAVEQEKNQTGYSAVGGLALYKTRDAVPYLNPLVAEGTDFTRLNAISALAGLADHTSIPFLIKGLDNDDRQQMVAYFAYATLRRLVPSLGPAKMRDDFLAHKDAEIQILKQWWEWEQVKAKKAAATQTQPATTINPSAPDTAPAKP